MAIISSLSKDGELGATLGRLHGARVVRGSPTRDGTERFRKFYRVMKKENYSVIILPDGPKGPRYVAKLGVVVLAHLSGNLVIPMSYAVDRDWRIRSWDRLIIPKPFSKISIAIGEDIRVGRDVDDLEPYRRQVKNALLELNARVSESDSRV